MSTDQKRRLIGTLCAGSVIPALFVLLVSLLMAILEAGLNGLLVIVLFVVAGVLLLLGAIPFVGVVLYHEITKLALNATMDVFNVHIPVAANIILYSFSVFALLLTLINTVLMFTWSAKKQE